jgi:hypothetical protein
VKEAEVSKSEEVNARRSRRNGRAYIVVHEGRAEEEDGVVVGELGPVEVGAVMVHMGAVIHLVVLGDIPNALDPVPRLLGPLGIRLVSGIAGQTGAEVEEAAVGDGWSPSANSVSVLFPTQTNSLFL